MNLLEIKENQALKIQNKYTSSEFQKLVPETKYSNLKKVVCQRILIFVQQISMNHNNEIREMQISFNIYGNTIDSFKEFNAKL